MGKNSNQNILAVSNRFTTYFKGFLLIGVTLIGAVFVYYTNQTISDIQKSEARVAETYTRIWQLVASDSVSGPVTSLLFDEVILKSSFPIVVTDSLGHPLFWKELSNIPQDASDPEILEKVKKRAEEMKREKGEIPISIDSVVIYRLYYGDTEMIDRLRLIPFIEMALVLSFIILALIGFQYIRRSEQRSIWVGMAKETAHQLGTPISSLMGWTNLLKSGETVNTFSPDEIHGRIENDLARLEMVANRFGRIGSIPKLEPQDLNELIEEVVEYFRYRLPHGGAGVKMEFVRGDIPQVDINRDLFGWVIENLLKNALEAVDSKTGHIIVKTYPASSGKTVYIEVIDNGRGIPRGNARRIFRPGYTTKRRGWGLGLSLARRIVHDYHRGHISLAASEPGQGARFIVVLPARTGR